MAEAPDDVVFTPTSRTIEGSQLTAFTRFCEAETGLGFEHHGQLHEFSVRELQRFWTLFLRWSDLSVAGEPDPACTDDRSCEHGVFFERLQIGYVENALRADGPGDEDRVAVIAHRVGHPPVGLTLGELRARVAGAARGFQRIGVTQGDRVVAVTRNNAEAVIAALAAAAIGATFASAAPDMGVPTILSRFEQLEPTALVANVTPGDDPRTLELSEHVADVAGRLTTLEAIVTLDDGPLRPGLTPPVIPMAELLTDGAELETRRLPFNHPLFVLFSSGTTGRPKGIVHGTGGTLLEHVKEHRLHHDFRPGDRLFFHTSTGWMMWNWQLSALASGASIVLYDGPIAGPDTLWRIVEAEDVTVFGTSPPYLRLCEELEYSPRRELDLPHLRAVLSTGSILHDRQYDWVRDHVGPLPLQSISGGTDIIGCFALGNPNLPVRRGHLQCRSLGLDVQALPTDASPAGSGIGELVCRNPFPSRPLGFVGDANGTRFHEAYFAQNEGMWTHGDLLEIDDDGQIRMHGRSDGVLNVQGVRVGPTEIYSVLADFSEIREALAVEQETRDGPDASRVVLFVVMVRAGSLDTALVGRIRRELARRASPAHVPKLVVEVDDLPATHSGKRSERAVRDAVNGAELANLESLANPISVGRLIEALRLADAAVPDREHTPHGAADATEVRLRSMWEAVLGVAPIAPGENFFDVGGTSLGAVRLLNAIHEDLGIDLPLSLFLHAQTVEAMANVIDGKGDELSLVVPLKEGSGGRPLFIVHGLLGDIFDLRAFVTHVDTTRSIYGVRAQGLDPRRPAHTTVEDMATEYVHQIQLVQPEGPYALAGYSFGGLVAFEMARRLVEAGEVVDRLVLIDSYVHERCLTRTGRAWFSVARTSRVVAAGLHDPRTKLPRFVRRTVGNLPASTKWIDPGEEVLPPLLRYMEQVNLAAYEAHQPGPYPGSAAFIRARGRERRECNPIPVWSRVVQGGLAIEDVPGGHLQLLSEPHVDVVARRVAAYLDGSPA